MTYVPRQPRQCSASVCAQQLEGRVASVVWKDSEADGPMILRLHDEQTVKTESGSDRINVGDYLKFLGRYVEHPKYGRQFQAASWLPGVNGDRKGAIKYLSELCDGIGPTTAKKLVERYDLSAVKVLREEPDRVVADKLLTLETAEVASATLRKHERTERVTIALHDLFAGRGFGGRAIKSCIDSWQDRAADVVRSCPWKLLLYCVPGAGWKRTDQLYLDLGFQAKALLRQAMAGWYALRQAQTGSTWHPLSLFSRGVVEQLGANEARCDDALRVAKKACWVEENPAETGERYIADPRAASNERAVAYYVSRLMHAGSAAWPLPLPPHVSEHQMDQLQAAFVGRVALLTGTPGTGKTYAAAAALKLIAECHGEINIAVAAPTGKAAVRITEALRKHGLCKEATTIHRLLEITKVGYDGDGWQFAHGPSNPLPYAWIAVDEVSMLDCDLAASLFAAIRPGTHVLLIGDDNQLPPVGHGAPLRDIIKAGLPRAELNEIKRNSGLITSGCKQIKDGQAPRLAAKLDLEAGDNLRLVYAGDDVDQLHQVRTILEALRAKPGIDVIWDVAILTPMNDRGRCSRKPLNDYLQQLLNPVRDNDPKAGQQTWRLRDKVICLKNGIHNGQFFNARKSVYWCDSWSGISAYYREDKQCFVANGELGRIISVDRKNSDCIVRFDAPTRYIRVPAPKRVNHDDGTDSAREDGFALGYAMTGHKSQGSEWPYVLVILDPAGDRVASREWIYTAISRASKACILIGTEETLKRQLRRAELPGRKTLLVELIEEELGHGKTTS